MDKYEITIQYRDSKMDIVAEKTYDLDTYMELLRQQILKSITDVEDLVNDTGEYTSKSEWDDDVWIKFLRFKHRMLDTAGEIGRVSHKIKVAKE